LQDVFSVQSTKHFSPRCIVSSMFQIAAERQWECKK
jgi:hypothetical protein